MSAPALRRTTDSDSMQAKAATQLERA